MISCCCNSWYLLPKVRKGDFISKKKLFMGGTNFFWVDLWKSVVFHISIFQ